MNIDTLTFAPCPPTVATKAAIKVAVLKGDAIKITLNASAFEKLGKPKTVAVEAASHGDDNFMRLKMGAGWPVTVRAAPRGGKNGAAGRESAAIVVRAHPFDPGVTHPAGDVDAQWSDDAVVIGLPDWKAMLEKIEGED